MLIKVGEIFPLAIPSSNLEGSVIQMNGEDFFIMNWVEKPTPEMCEEYRGGGFVYGVFEKENVPFFLVLFPESEMIIECSINVLAEFERGNGLCDFLSGKSDRLNMFLVDSKTNNLCAIRGLIFGPTAGTLLREACARQAAHYSSAGDVSAKIYEIMDNYTTQELFEGATLFQLASRGRA